MAGNAGRRNKIPSANPCARAKIIVKKLTVDADFCMLLYELEMQHDDHNPGRIHGAHLCAKFKS